MEKLIIFLRSRAAKYFVITYRLSFRAVHVGLLMTGLAFSCSDDQDPLPFESQVKLLAGEESNSKSWIVESIVENNQTVLLTDCQKDNVFTFHNNKDQAYTHTAGEQKCDPEDTDTLEEGNWFISTDGTKVAINATKIFRAEGMNFYAIVTAKPGKIVELTATRFKIELSSINLLDSNNTGASLIVLTLVSPTF